MKSIFVRKLRVPALGLILASAAQSQDPLWWGPAGTGAPLGGAGLWDLTTERWAENLGGGYQLWPGSGTSRRAVFAGTGGVVSLAGAISAAGLRFDSDGYVLDFSGGANTLTLHDANGFAPRIDVLNAGHVATILGPIEGSNGLAVGGHGTIVLARANSFSAGMYDLNVASATLQLMTATGSVDSNLALYLGDGTGDNSGGGGGTFALNNEGASGATTQNLFSLNAIAGEGIVATHRVAPHQLSLVFGSVSRSTGATINYVTTGGVNGTESRINVTSQATGFLNQGSFFGGADYAWKDSGEFIRAVNYGPDAGTTLSNGGTSVTGTHVHATGAVTAQASATFSTLKLSSGSNFTLAGGATLTTSGVLKTGGNSTAISGGNAIRPGSSRQFVVRVDGAADALAINTVIANASGGASTLTKSGEGLLTLGGANTYTGTTFLNAGTLSIATFPTASGSASPLGLGNASNAALRFSGGTLRYTGGSVTSTRKLDFSAGGGGIEVQQAATVLTLDSTIFGANFAATDALVKTGPGTLALVGDNDNSGLNAVVRSGTLQLGKISADFLHAVSSLVVENGGTAQLTGTGDNQIYDQGPVTVHTGGTLDFNGRDEHLFSLAGGGVVTNHSTSADSLLVIGGWGGFSRFDGSIMNGLGGRALSLNKVGGGTLVLGGASNHTGETLVSGGTLVVDGSLTSTFTNVLGGAILAGSGSVNDVTIAPGGLLSPGPGTALLTIGGDLTLQSGSTVRLEIAGPAPGIGYDALEIFGTAALDGLLEVAFAGGFTPVGGEVFDFFGFAVRTGTFFDVSLPELSGTLSWETSNLYTEGRVSIVPEPATCGLLLLSGCMVFGRRRRAIS